MSSVLSFLYPSFDQLFLLIYLNIPFLLEGYINSGLVCFLVHLYLFLTDFKLNLSTSDSSIDFFVLVHFKVVLLNHFFSFVQ